MSATCVIVFFSKSLFLPYPSPGRGVSPGLLGSPASHPAAATPNADFRALAAARVVCWGGSGEPRGIWQPGCYLRVGGAAVMDDIETEERARAMAGWRLSK